MFMANEFKLLVTFIMHEMLLGSWQILVLFVNKSSGFMHPHSAI